MKKTKELAWRKKRTEGEKVTTCDHHDWEMQFIKMTGRPTDTPFSILYIAAPLLALPLFIFLPPLHLSLPPSHPLPLSLFLLYPISSPLSLISLFVCVNTCLCPSVCACVLVCRSGCLSVHVYLFVHLSLSLILFTSSAETSAFTCRTSPVLSADSDACCRSFCSRSMTAFVSCTAKNSTQTNKILTINNQDHHSQMNKLKTIPSFAFSCQSSIFRTSP